MINLKNDNKSQSIKKWIIILSLLYSYEAKCWEVRTQEGSQPNLCEEFLVNTSHEDKSNNEPINSKANFESNDMFVIMPNFNGQGNVTGFKGYYKSPSI